MKFNKKKDKKNNAAQKPKTRQELRKIQRKAKKEKKHLYFQGKHNSHDVELKKKDLSTNKKKGKEEIKNQRNVQIKEDKYHQNLNLKLDKLKKEMDSQKIEQLKMRNKSDDLLIKKYEKQLKLKKRKSKNYPKSLGGLDFLIEACDNPEIMKLDPDYLDESGLDLEQDFAIITNKKRKMNEEKDIEESKEQEESSELEDEEGESELEDEEGESELEDEEGESELEDEVGESELEDEVGESELEDEVGESELEVDNENKFDENKKDDKLWEDIYGRTRDAKGNVVTSKYIPPQKREMSNNDQLKRMQRQMKGLLNRLAESNMKGIALQIEQIYLTNSRHSTNETLTKLIFEAIVSPTLTPEGLITEYSMIVGILHAHIGPEIGAHILQELIKHFHQEYLKYTDHELKTKELANLILFISYLYCFNIFNSILIYDILELFANNFQEKDIELILIILKSAGFTLRKDDPSALKKLILNLQTKANQKNEHGTRCQFMIEILLAIKNNNMTKIPNYDPSHLERLKKSLKFILRNGTYISEIKISLEDLLKADERGRWWVVGSAWTGPAENTEINKTTTPNIHLNNEHSQKLLEIARKQRMNTDSRRNIFCILMSAQDYNQAYEKLLQLSLKNRQERDIIYVLVHCCLQEKKYNPYYGFVAQQFCLYQKQFQLTYQYTLWDRLRELDKFTDTKITNLALLTKHLIIERVLPLTVIKAVEFDKLEKPLVRFLRQLLLGLLLDKDEENCKAVFDSVTLKENSKQFRDGLRLFLKQFLLRKLDASNIENKELLKNRISLTDKIISLVEDKVKF